MLKICEPPLLTSLLGAGSGIGVAVAFGAPIGGLLFAFEEVASWFATSLWWQIFFGCMLSVLTLDTLRSAQRAMTQGAPSLSPPPPLTLPRTVLPNCTPHCTS